MHAGKTGVIFIRDSYLGGSASGGKPQQGESNIHKAKANALTWNRKYFPIKLEPLSTDLHLHLFSHAARCLRNMCLRVYATGYSSILSMRREASRCLGSFRSLCDP